MVVFEPDEIKLVAVLFTEANALFAALDQGILYDEKTNIVAVLNDVGFHLYLKYTYRHKQRMTILIDLAVVIKRNWNLVFAFVFSEQGLLALIEDCFPQ